MLKRTNIEERLKVYRNKTTNEDDVLKQVRAILKEDSAKNKAISKTLADPQEKEHNDFNFDLLESGKIYHINQIQKICIDYRLRFLSSKYFKGKFPQEAIYSIKKLEKEHKTTLNGFKIIAPSKLFKLENADDPLLFAPLGNDYFYLVHKWGNDLHPLRKLLVLPFRNFITLTILVLLVSWLLTLLMPIEMFTHEKNSSYFWILFFFMFKMVASITIFYGVALGKNFNYAIWKSKYFNA
ncbi:MULTISPECIES: hypothetical protein [Galbibacter]|uniref:Uncharacterized protein n=1 Tax=Galbibacter pacificus TaxID=2996052 RepID=A0ABT6FQ61_9FLAO|nr:hypothetical protein [Galbibacter pacificus]MDG3582136.1 hypothetical protein [Galbibacter pacificus]MDG3585388.1 hypothetical protein [Galbibacter pacificus]